MSAARRPVVAVVGAGFSGTLTALHLLRNGPQDLQVLLIERGGGFGRGLAYDTHNPRHLLNVRVGNMSAWPDDSSHLERWLNGRGHMAHGAAFITRGEYGAYLAALLGEAIGAAGGAGRLLLDSDEVVGLDGDDGTPRLTLAMGRTLNADAVVLALGNLPPMAPEGSDLEGLPPQLYAADPWATQALEGLPPDASILLLGSGLTMVDTAIELDARGHLGPILAISRRGLTPRRHGDASPGHPDMPPCAPLPLSHRLGRLRRRARQTDWRLAVDEQRPAAQTLWRQASMVERRRFLRHLRPWWDVHRHRMAPAVADWLEAQQAHGRLRVAAGRLRSASEHAGHARVIWRPRGSAEAEVLDASRVINCSGVGGDLARTRDPLLRGLIDGGVGRLDPLGLGLEVDAGCRVIDASGRANPRLFAVGPITRGSLWEITAVPDVRGQVAALAAALARTRCEAPARPEV